eukprot:SAG11_NODE_15602_length_571_cov_1.050740_1_plen_98_part_01
MYKFIPRQNETGRLDIPMIVTELSLVGNLSRANSGRHKAQAWFSLPDKLEIPLFFRVSKICGPVCSNYLAVSHILAFRVVVTSGYFHFTLYGLMSYAH